MLTLNAKTREELRSKVQELRDEKIIPAVIYGKGVESTPIKVVFSDFNKIYKQAGESTIIKIVLDGKEEKGYSVLIREVQTDPVSGDFLHADFYRLPMNEEVEVTIPLDFIGESPAEKELGGVLIKNIHELNIKALPENLIHSVEVNISSLATFEDEIKVKDLQIPSTVNVLADSEEVVALVGRVEEEKIEEEPEKENIEEIEVVGAKKEEEAGEEEVSEESSKEKKE
jgi:large subunit ribosomal protein L25